MFVDGQLNGSTMTGEITFEVHLIEGLKANLLLGTDVLGPEHMKIDFEKHHIAIGSCKGLQVPISIINRASPHLQRIVLNKEELVVPANSTIKVPVSYHGTLPEDRDFMFDPTHHLRLGVEGGIYTHIR